MNKKKILIILRTAFASRTAHHVLSLLLTGIMLGGIGLTLRSDIENIRLYVQSVLDRDPNYKNLQDSVSENMIRGKIDIESQLVEDDAKEESKTLVSNDTKTGYDSYTPSSSSSNSSNTSNNTSSSNTSSSISSNNNSSNNNDNSNSNNSNSNNSNKQEETVDKSAFNGKDAIISEGQPFNPMNALQLYACDITGENITNSIIITENNVDIYKPGVYNVKASIALKNGKTLDKKFAVRVEPTVLDLAVNDVKVSKTELKKEEDYTMNFAVNSSKSYIDVEKVVINKKEYEVLKILEDEIERYSVNLMAPNKAGYESLKLQKVIMSDKTVVDIDKTVNINVLKEDATLNDVVVEDESNGNNALKISFKLKDVDNTISEPKICIYDKDGNLVLENPFSKSKYSSYTKVSTKINLDKAGIYTVKVLANKNDESKEQTNEEKSIELFSKEIAVNMKSVSDDEDMSLLPMNENYDDEGIEAYSEANLNSVSNDKEIESYSESDEVNFRNILRASSGNITGSDTTEQKHNISITGNVLNDKGEMPSGTFQVVVPTTASFTVDKDGKFIGTTITIRNQGYQNIDVYAYKFIDVDGSEGINVKPKSEVTDQSSRSDIAMNILGNNSTAYFKTGDKTSSNSGIYQNPELTTPASSDGIKISRISANSEGKLTLQGEAGKNSNIDTAISNTFTLILKIKKSTN
ncbi:hypothetical protein [uncultured Clostridium sp.]|uniref:hypothetical protein n=1 Tax=uncultured Clostridium sp. TaxID=59620 RepID=UPI0025D20BCA|nr:hypothetical protein [uncultured Clostridium sp.]